MTDKNWERFRQASILLAVFLLGLGMGGFITSERYNSEIRTDQLELKKDVAEIGEDKTIIEAIVKTLLFQIKQLKIERQELRELKILFSSKGE